jgi:hypothetical protein
MFKVAPLCIDDGHSILVETDLDLDMPSANRVVKGEMSGILPGDSPVGRLEDLSSHLDDVKYLVASCAQTVFSALGPNDKPGKITLELGIKFAGEAGTPVLAKASAEASLKIKLEW